MLLEDPTLAHYTISSRDSRFRFLYMLLFDRMHDAMYEN